VYDDEGKKHDVNFNLAKGSPDKSAPLTPSEPILILGLYKEHFFIEE
jgi:hypothetical protein